MVAQQNWRQFCSAKDADLIPVWHSGLKGLRFQLWLRYDPWPGNFICCGAAKRKEGRKREGEGRKERRKEGKKERRKEEGGRKEERKKRRKEKNW